MVLSLLAIGLLLYRGVHEDYCLPVKNKPLQLFFTQNYMSPFRLVPITTDIVGSTPAQGEVYNMM